MIIIMIWIMMAEQENNAVVTIDITDSAAPKLGGLFPLGFQSWADYKVHRP
jgi:hypothetical protein